MWLCGWPHLSSCLLFCSKPSSAKPFPYLDCSSASGCRRASVPSPIPLFPNTYLPPMTTSSPVPRSQAVEAALPLLLKQLKLARFRSHWQPLSQQAEAEGWSPGQFLYALCEQEVDHRLIARRQRLLREAHLPWQKGLDGFDHQHLEPKHWQELQVLSRSHTWLLQAENLLLFGPSGVGKTHLAIAITMAMIEQDQACRFFSATALV